MHLPINDSIFLRTLEVADVPLFFKAISENRSHLRKWVPWIDYIISEKEVQKLIEEGAMKMKTQQSLKMGIFSTHKLIGYLEMQDWDHTLRKAKIGYWLIKKAEGENYMYAASSVFIQYLFNQLELNKIELVHLLENKRSAALAKRLGFKVEGILRDNILINGAFKDLVVQGLLKSEFKLTN